MKKVYLVGLLSLCVLLVASCGSKRVYTKGKYVEPDRVDLLSDKFVESDLQKIAKDLTDSFLTSPLISGEKSKPAIIISVVTNGTDEHIDILSLTNKIRTKLIKSGRFVFLNERLRKELSEEYEYESSGYVDPKSAKKKGNQMGADWLISGHISAIKQPVGRKEIIYYKTTLEATDLTSSRIVWADEVEIKKQFKKKRIRQ